MQAVVEQTPRGGLCVYNGEQRVLARCPNFATKDANGKVIRTDPDLREIDFCRPLPAVAVDAVVKAVMKFNPEQDWIE